MATGRFFRRGISKIYFLPAVANKAAPTGPEITAGTNLTPHIQDPGSFDFNNAPIQTPDLDSTFTSMIPGEDTAEAPVITFYDNILSAAIRMIFGKVVTGFILRAPYDLGTAKRAEVFPVTVTGRNDTWSAGNEAALMRVGFAVTDTPAQDAVLP